MSKVQDAHPDQAIFDLLDKNARLRKFCGANEDSQSDDILDAIYNAISENEKQIGMMPTQTIEGFLAKTIMSLEENMACLNVHEPHYIIEHQTLGMAKDLYENEMLQAFLKNVPLSIEEMLPNCKKQLDQIKALNTKQAA